MFVLMPHEASSGFWKYSRPLHGPHRVTTVTDTGLYVVPVDDVRKEPINVHFFRVRPCYEEIPDVSWTRPRSKRDVTNTAAPYGLRSHTRSSTRAC